MCENIRQFMKGYKKTLEIIKEDGKYKKKNLWNLFLNRWNVLDSDFSILSPSNVKVFISWRKYMNSAIYVKNNWHSSLTLDADDFF